MKYRLWDEAGFLIAEIKFHSRTNEELIAVHLQDVCEALMAASYHAVWEEED